MHPQKQPLFILILLSITSLYAQVTISGRIKDKHTGRTLAAANIEIVGTFQGTISNEEGKYSLQLNTLPAVIQISYIGYESYSFTYSENTGANIDILLNPIIYDTEPIVVIAEDPAMAIMREVIKQKNKWQDKLKTYKAQAYSRLVLENDSGIVSIAESKSEAFWDRDKGPREVIKSKRQTNNLSENQNFAFASYIPNFYDNDIEIVGYKVVGPTNIEAFDYYEFKLQDIRYIDHQKVYIIDVIPTGKLQPTFTGQVSVLDSLFALLSVDLKPNKSILFPPPIQALDLSYKQQFRNFGKSFWLPVDFRVNGDIKIGFTGLQFPNIHYKRVTGLSKYEINISLPDSLYENENFLMLDSLAIKQDTIFVKAKPPIPLSHNEENAYDTMDSSATLEKAFRPRGFLARFIEIRTTTEDSETSSDLTRLFSHLSPQLWFNRVDAWHVGFKYENNLSDKLAIQFNTSYKTGLSRWAYGSSIEYQFKKNRAAWMKLNFQIGTESRYHSPTYSITIASLAPLLGQDDYFDYYWKKSININFGYSVQKINSVFKIDLNSEMHTALSKQSDFNLVWSDYEQRLNPEIEEGNLRSILFSAAYGENYIPFGVIGQNRLALEIEYSSPDILSSNFTFTRYLISLDIRINTFLKRRLLPAAFDIHFSAGTSRGELPPQRLMHIDGIILGFSPFSVLRSLPRRPYEGEHFLAVFWEHNFRTIPFELLGLDYLARKGIGIILHGACGRTWIDQARTTAFAFSLNSANRLHSEIGISINGLFGLLRMDFTQRLDRNIFHIGFGLNRFF